MKPTISEIVHITDDANGDDVDDLSLIYIRNSLSLTNKGTSAANPISVEEYSEDRDHGVAIMASLVPVPESNGYKSTRAKRVIDLDQYPDSPDDEVQILDPNLTSFPRIIKRPRYRGKCSTFMCEICADEKPKSQLFDIMGCTHSYCSDCVSNYVASRLQQNSIQITCPVPGCWGIIDPFHCRGILPSQVFARWGDALCEASIMASQKTYYCPYKDCSALLIDDMRLEGEVLTLSECPNCRRLICAQCKVPWHDGLGCSEFQNQMSSKDEDGPEYQMLMKLAKKRKWKRCPKCKILVERTLGCSHMRCRCGCDFCYQCGAAMVIGFCTTCIR